MMMNQKLIFFLYQMKHFQQYFETSFFQKIFLRRQ